MAWPCIWDKVISGCAYCCSAVTNVIGMYLQPQFDALNKHLTLSEPKTGSSNRMNVLTVTASSAKLAAAVAVAMELFLFAAPKEQGVVKRADLPRKTQKSKRLVSQGTRREI